MVNPQEKSVYLRGVKYSPAKIDKERCSEFTANIGKEYPLTGTVNNIRIQPEGLEVILVGTPNGTAEITSFPNGFFMYNGLHKSSIRVPRECVYIPEHALSPVIVPEPEIIPDRIPEPVLVPY